MKLDVSFARDICTRISKNSRICVCCQFFQRETSMNCTANKGNLSCQDTKITAVDEKS